MYGRADVLASLAGFRGGALALTGPPGIGRTAILGALAARTQGAVGLVDDGDDLDRAEVEALLRETGALIVARRSPLPGLPEVALPPLDGESADRLLADAITLPADMRRALVELADGVPGHLLALASAARAGVVSAVLPPGGRYRTAIAKVLAEEPDILIAACGGRVAPSEVAIRMGVLLADGTTSSPAVAATIRAEAGAVACRATWSSLAETEPDPARALCHRASAAPGQVGAAELAAAARSAEAIVASKLYRMAAVRTTEPRRRARLLLDAAQAAWAAGRSARALADLDATRRQPEVAGRIALLRGEIELRDGDPAIAAHELAAAAHRITESKERAVALMLAGEARRMAGDITGHATLARELVALGSADPLAAAHSSGLAATFAGNHTAARGPLRHASAWAARDTRRLVWAGEVALTLGQIPLAYEHATAAVGMARTEAPQLLPAALVHLATVALAADRVAVAVRAATEGRACCAGQRNVAVEHTVLLALAAVSLGDRDTAMTRLAEAAPAIADRGLGRPAAYAAWARACVDLIDDRPDEALSRLRTMATGVGRAHPGIRALAVPQLVEAAVRCGRPEVAERALARYDAWAMSLRGPHWRAVSHRCRALLDPDPPAHFERALALHRQAGATLELARTHLLFAHHLRRDRRPTAAREHLREAMQLFHTHGATYWVERTSTELRAAAPAPAPGGLTPQQTQIARLVADGETNREIARTLVLSPRTVEHHLRNIYTRLGIRSRTELARLVVSADR
jgi:DNA-binding CsgD family transcriptional regulator